MKLRESIRYSGTPLKYSFSEAKDQKSLSVIELNEKGNISIRTVALKPIFDMSEISGKFIELTDYAYYSTLKNKDDYLRITLLDENDIPDAMARLRQIYKNAMVLRYDNARTRGAMQILGASEPQNKTPFELFSEFFFKQNNAEMTKEQTEFVSEIIESVGGELL